MKQSKPVIFDEDEIDCLMQLYHQSVEYWEEDPVYVKLFEKIEQAAGAPITDPSMYYKDK